VVVDAQAIVILFAVSAQTTVLVGVFYRLGTIKAGFEGLGERVKNLEQKG
jgi:hypothetical protein